MFALGSRCGVLVCCDCFLARKHGTKYKSINAVTKPTRTRKRFRSGLDMNLWPLCLKNQIHDVDKLIMTEMSPDAVSKELLLDIHSLKDRYGLSAKCKCCKKPQDSNRNEHEPASDPESQYTVAVLKECPECKVQFGNYSLNCKRIHLVHHHLATLGIGESDTKCNMCKDFDTGDPANLVAHMAIVHRVADKHFQINHDKHEDEKQEETALELDTHSRCAICKKSLVGVGKDKKRTHYFHHLSELMLGDIKARAYSEISWGRGGFLTDFSSHLLAQVIILSKFAKPSNIFPYFLPFPPVFFLKCLAEGIRLNIKAVGGGGVMLLCPFPEYASASRLLHPLRARSAAMLNIREAGCLPMLQLFTRRLILRLRNI